MIIAHKADTLVRIYYVSQLELKIVYWLILEIQINVINVNKIISYFYQIKLVELTIIVYKKTFI